MWKRNLLRDNYDFVCQRRFLELQDCASYPYDGSRFQVNLPLCGKQECLPGTHRRKPKLICFILKLLLDTWRKPAGF